MKTAIAFLGALALLGACNKGPSKTQCKQLLEHLADLEVAKAGATGTGSDASPEAMKAETQKNKAALVEARTDEFVGMCTEKIAKPRVECALGARDFDAVAKCDLQ